MKPIQRRAFIRSAGAAVAVTTAAAATTVAATTAAAAASTAAEATTATAAIPGMGATPAAVTPSADRTAIQQLHHAYVAQLNSRHHEGLRALFAREPANEPDPERQTLRTPVYILGQAQHLDTIAIAPNQQHATARFHCLARLEAAVTAPPSFTLLEMARQQGQGVTQWWESGVLENEYVKVASLWKIARVSFT